ncbi:MAG: phosphatase PAP2 family protein [Lachnospiraceae bacterium]
MDFLRLLEGVRTPFLDKLFQLITYFGQELIIIAVICALYWCIDKRFAYQVGFVFFSAGLFVQACKITFRVPRPWVLDPSFHPVKSAIGGATGYSFPSGHTQGGTSLFAPLALHSKKIGGKVLCIFAFLAIGFSRLYLGVHTPKDVLVSMGISLVFSWLVWHYEEWFFKDNSHVKILSIGLSVISILVCLYSLFLLSTGTIDIHYATDCCKVGATGLGFSLGFYLERTYLNFKTQTKTTRGQIFKLLFGLSIAILLKIGAKMLFGSSILFHMLEYFLLVLWVLIIYPYCFSKLRPH